MKLSEKTYKILIIVLGVLILGTVIGGIIFSAVKGKSKEQAVALQENAGEQEKKGGFIVVEKEITSDIIEDGLRDMGFLITEEYYFTEVIGYSKVKKLFNLIKLGFTESYYIASYDGVLEAGIDFTEVKVEKNDYDKSIIVTIPKAVIHSISIDPESFKLYDEKHGVGNPISATEYNDSLIELEETAKEKALERGILKEADKNAKAIITNFVSSLGTLSDYRVRINTK